MKLPINPNSNLKNEKRGSASLVPDFGLCETPGRQNNSQFVPITVSNQLNFTQIYTHTQREREAHLILHRFSAAAADSWTCGVF